MFNFVIGDFTICRQECTLIFNKHILVISYNNFINVFSIIISVGIYLMPCKWYVIQWIPYIFTFKALMWVKRSWLLSVVTFLYISSLFTLESCDIIIYIYVGLHNAFIINMYILMSHRNFFFGTVKNYFSFYFKNFYILVVKKKNINWYRF